MTESKQKPVDIVESVFGSFKKDKPTFPVCTHKAHSEAQQFPKCHGDDTAHLEAAHFTEPQQILCKWCGAKDIKKYGTRKDVQEYICLICRRKFIAKDAPYKKQTTTEQIGRALISYYDGLSFEDVARQAGVVESTVYRWVLSYTTKAIDLVKSLKPKVSDTWVVDETVVKIAGRNYWFWDLIDDGTRFLLASHLSRNRGINDVKTVMNRAKVRAGKSPRFILSDSLGVYPDGIEQIFGADSKHIQSHGLTHEINTNLIERFHGTIKERTKVLRGFKTTGTAELILEGFLVNYNFFRPHMSLNDRTPAEVAGIKAPCKNWTEIVRQDR